MSATLDFVWTDKNIQEGTTLDGKWYRATRYVAMDRKQTQHEVVVTEYPGDDNKESTTILASKFIDDPQAFIDLVNKNQQGLSSNSCCSSFSSFPSATPSHRWPPQPAWWPHYGPFPHPFEPQSWP